MSSPGHLLTTVIHNKSYPAISTSRPELSQAGKTVLVGGGSTGIGFSIAKSFAAAGAARVIIAGRRQSALDSAIAQALTEYPGTEVLGYACDVADEASTEKLWSGLKEDGILVDILVLNAAKLSPEHTMLSLGTKKVWEEFIINVKAPLDMTERFYKQEGRDSSRKLVSLTIILISLSGSFTNTASLCCYCPRGLPTIMLPRDRGQTIWRRRTLPRC